MRAFAAGAGALVLMLAWVWPMPLLTQDLLAGHMAQHLVAMNGGGLLLALAWQRAAPIDGIPTRALLLAATALQLALLIGWHVPSVLEAAHHSRSLRIAMQGSTFAAALFFWRQILASRTTPLWLRIFCLLATAKLFCLGGAVLVFSRREIFGQIGNPSAWQLTALADQQLAGLMMVSGCALIYVTAATALFAAWLFHSDRIQSRHVGTV